MPPHSTKPLPDTPGYLVSRQGVVWTDWWFKGRGPNRKKYRTGKWRRVRVSPGSLGYLAMNVNKAADDGTVTCRSFYVHHLVLLTFVGPCPDGLECRHLNGDPGDCRLDNLAWGTRAENQADRMEHWLARLSERELADLEAMPRTRTASAKMAKSHGVRVNMVYAAQRRIVDARTGV